jgi:hypothetical protein
MTSTARAPSFAASHQVESSTFSPVRVNSEVDVAIVFSAVIPYSRRDVEEAEHRAPEDFPSLFHAVRRF